MLVCLSKNTIPEFSLDIFMPLSFFITEEVDETEREKKQIV